MSSAEQIPLIRGELSELRECVSCLSVDTVHKVCHTYCVLFRKVSESPL